MANAIKIGVIGGSGIYDLSFVEFVKEHKIKTPFGSPSDVISELKINNSSFYFLPRHGKGHRISPSEINYCANIYALKKLGVNYLISISAVGSLKDDYPPGTFVLPDQFIDWTKGLRRRSFFGEGMVGHVSVALPVEKSLQQLIYQKAKELKLNVCKDGSYLCIEGPQFSTKAESNFYRSLGADVIGMTNVPEAYLAKEAGMAYATIAMVTDFDGWKEVHVNLDEVMKTMQGNYKNAQMLLKFLIPSLTQEDISYKTENQNSIMTTPKHLTDKHNEIKNVILS